jgi:deoxyribodipyrimidine photo-lyase
MEGSIVWFRQDLRLADNASLLAASSGPILAVYILDDDGPWPMGGAHRWWLHGSLQSLVAGLESCGAKLILRRGRAAAILAELAKSVGAITIHAGQTAEPASRAQEAAVQAALPPGVTLQLHRTATLFDFGAVRTKTGGAYGIFTPFARAARALAAPAPPRPAPKRLQGLDAESDTLESWKLLPVKPDWAGGFRDTWRPGEATALARAKQFMAERLDAYHEGRNTPGADLTSMLSPHLHWGELSPSQLWHWAAKAGSGQGLEVYQSELLWHEFSVNLLWRNPQMPDVPQRVDFGRLPWRHDPAGLRAWQRGRTGVPIVDAGMRQLWHIGWMHNRVRMITASYLVKHLLVSWVEGERWFWDTLVDGDLAVNAQSWQWVAGCGTDSQPFFRVFNPVTQSEKFDGNGAYIRRWVPELAALPDRWIHAPWTAPAAVLAKAAITIGKDYPHPVVPLEQGRDRALAAFRTLRQAA